MWQVNRHDIRQSKMVRSTLLIAKAVATLIIYNEASKVDYRSKPVLSLKTIQNKTGQDKIFPNKAKQDKTWKTEPNQTHRHVPDTMPHKPNDHLQSGCPGTTGSCAGSDDPDAGAERGGHPGPAGRSSVYDSANSGQQARHRCVPRVLPAAKWAMVVRRCWVDACMSTCVCAWLHVCICAYACVRVGVARCVCESESASVCVCVCVCGVCVCVCVCVCLCLCVCVCVCVGNDEFVSVWMCVWDMMCLRACTRKCILKKIKN